MEPTKLNSLVMLLMLASCLMIFINMDKKYRLLEVGAFVMALCAQAYYTSISKNMIVELLFTLLWGWLTFRSYERNYIKDGREKTNS